MVRTLTFARPAGSDLQPTPGSTKQPDGQPSGVACEHRAVSRDGRIVCKKIVEGLADVTPNLCRHCPFRAANCLHLRFSLRLRSPSPLVVRYNGRTELWDDGPAQLAFDRAACAERVMPIHSPEACAQCALRLPAWSETSLAAAEAGSGCVVPFPARQAAAAG